jgi:biofilm PGA synthesis N-glycosyltransferase PgaC
MDWLFVLSASFITYTYLLYPLLIWAASSIRRQELASPLTSDACPAVTIVIAVHNEAARVERKIQNIRSLDYPQEKIDILFVSDGSTDQTVSTLQKYPDVRVLAYPQRQGKAYALNQALSTPCHDVILFNDVRQTADKQAIRLVISSLSQPDVGAVSGELMHHDPATQTGASIGLYWRYEKWIRKSESKFRSVVGATGAFKELAPGTLLDDFEIPMQIARSGYRVLFDHRALVYDNLQETLQGERTRKMRTLSGNFQSFAQNPWLFSPWHNPIWFQFLSHKVFRLLVPYAMLAALVSSILARHPLIHMLAALQIAFYACALAVHHFPALTKNKLLNFILVFCDLNWVAFMAGIHFFSGRLNTRWDKT